MDAFVQTVPTTPATITRPTTEYVVLTDTDLERQYRVIIENDEVTPMDFVILILLTIFSLTTDRAIETMLTAHNNGRAYVGSYPFQEAQDRVYQAHSQARSAGYPLSFYLEPEE